MGSTDMPRRVYRSPTGDLSSPHHALDLQKELPDTPSVTPGLAILDLSGKQFTPASLRELIGSLGQRIRGGVYGDLKLVLVVTDDATREFIALLSREYGWPMYVARSTDPGDVEEAEPLGDLTAAELETLSEVRNLGGKATVANLAAVLDLEPSAATNRLVNIERKGYLHRFKRPRRVGDLFVDPTTRREAFIAGEGTEDVPEMRGALLRGGIRANPYSRRRIELDQEAAERAREILRRRQANGH